MGNNQFGAKLKTAREKTFDPKGKKCRYLTQDRFAEEIAAALGSESYPDRATVGAWEAGRKHPRVTDKSLLQTIIRILFKFNTDFTPRDGNELLLAGGYAPLGEEELLSIFRIPFQELNPMSIRAMKNATLSKYLQTQISELELMIASGSSQLTLGAIVGSSGLFVDPPWAIWEIGQDVQNENTDLIQHMIESLLNDRRCLILGEPGEGKSTLLTKVFVELAYKFIDGRSAFLPVLLPLRRLLFLAKPSDDRPQLVWSRLREELGLPITDVEFHDLIQQKAVIFLLDGFDEIGGSINQQSTNANASNSLFYQRCLLTCRTQFYETFLSESPIAKFYTQKYILRPWSSVWQIYTAKYCQALGISSNSIIQHITKNRSLSDLAKRPLLLVMMLDIKDQISDEIDWDIVKLYERFTIKWLQHEAAKPDAQLTWQVKDEIIKTLAWHLFYTDHGNTTELAGAQVPFEAIAFSLDELKSALKPIWKDDLIHVPFHEVLNDVCYRTLFIRRGVNTYYFAHKSFQEYYAAKFMFDSIVSDTASAHNMLRKIVPSEVGNLLKKIARASSTPAHLKQRATRNLIQVYKNCTSELREDVVVRQQAGHLIGHFCTPEGANFIEENAAKDPNKWVQRGMLLGLALSCARQDVLEKYVALLENDPEAASINTGYYLIYYGDQDESEGILDAGGTNCTGTLKAIFRHIQQANIHNLHNIVLDLWTLKSLIQSRGIEILNCNRSYIPALRELVSEKVSYSSSVLQEQIEILGNLLSP